MANFSQSESTIEKGSDAAKDFLCSSCEDKKEDMKKWPVAKKVEECLRKCDVHKEENLNMFCKDHSQLCCTNCAFLNHRQCKMVMLISDIVKNNCTDLNQLSVTMQTFMGEMEELQEHHKASIWYVQSSFDEQLEQIHETRGKINAALDMLEKKTLKEMKDTLTELQASLRIDFHKCATLLDELKQLQDAIQDISDKSELELSFVASIKCQEKITQCSSYRKESFAQVKSSIAFQPNSEIVQYLSMLSGLGRIELIAQTFDSAGESTSRYNAFSYMYSTYAAGNKILTHLFKK